MSSTIVLIRRLAQPVEFLPTPQGTGPIRVLAEPFREDLGEATGAGMVYLIDLPDGIEVRPAEWRRIAYDHSAIGQLISATVRQNCSLLDLEPLGPDRLRRTEAWLRIALRDLATVFDIQTVDCALTSEGGLEVSVTGEHKNGERVTRVTSCELR
jgi:hypothetical protein